MWVRMKSGLEFGIKNGQPKGYFFVLASYHHPMSHTWRWALYFIKKPKLRMWKMNGFGDVQLAWFKFSWQQHCWKRN